MSAPGKRIAVKFYYARARRENRKKKRPALLMECRPSVVVYGAWNFSTPPS